MVRIGILCRNEKATSFVEQSIAYQSASTKILLYYINTCFTVNKLDKSKIIKFKLNNFHALLVTMLYFINVQYVIVDISLRLVSRMPQHIVVVLLLLLFLLLLEDNKLL